MTGRRRIIGIATVFLFGMALAACGGGGGATTGTATIQGSVPGSVFVAVDNDTNLEAGRVTATGTGTPKTFSMVVPTGRNYRFYVMENEGTASSRVYPMYIGTSNVFELDNTADGQIIFLGMVSPDMVTGSAAPGEHPPLMMSRGANTTIPPSLAGMAFSMDNVKGTTWSYSTMMTSGTMGWEHGTLSFGNSGGHMTGIVRNGTSLPNIDNIPYTMSLSGMLLNPDDDTFQCVVSRDRNMMVATFTDSTGGPAMMIALKRGGTFAPDGSDMTGTWRFQRLTAGGDNTTSGRAYGTMGIVSGSATILSMTKNAGDSEVGTTFTVSMDANGNMSKLGDSSFHGVMSMDRSMIVATDTKAGNPELWVMMRTTQGTTYSMSDMMGDWVMHSVSSGNPGSREWTFGHSVVDSSGNNTFTQMMGSGGMISPTQMTMTMNSATGAITMPGAGGGMGGGMMGGGMMTQTFHGIMNESKNMMVSTYTDGAGGYPFSILVK